MAQPHKGNRTLIAARPAQDVYEEVRRRAAALGISISQYASDVLAEHIGRPDLVRELNRDRDFTVKKGGTQAETNRKKNVARKAKKKQRQNRKKGR